MKILLIAPPWIPTPPVAYGGTETVIDTLAQGLQKAGHEVTLFATGDSTSPVNLSYHFETALGVGRTDSTLSELLHVAGAYGIAKHFDIVHDHTLIGPSFGARYPHLPIVTTNHLPFQSGLDEYYRMISNKVPVIAISQSQAKLATGVRLAGVVHHGLDFSKFPIGDGSGGYALFLGRISPDKGVHIAIDAARAAGTPLLIAAKCREKSEIEYFTQQVEPRLGGNIEYLGEVGRLEKLRLLGRAKCLLNPIAWPEPFGMVMLEALACGTPVVTTSFGAAPEIVDHGTTGFLADSLPELISALGKVDQLSRPACRYSAEQRFSSEIMVAKHILIYRKAIESVKTSTSLVINSTNRFDHRPGWGLISPTETAETFLPASGM